MVMINNCILFKLNYRNNMYMLNILLTFYFYFLSKIILILLSSLFYRFKLYHNKWCHDGSRMPQHNNVRGLRSSSRSHLFDCYAH